MNPKTGEILANAIYPTLTRTIIKKSPWTDAATLPLPINMNRVLRSNLLQLRQLWTWA